MYFLIKNTVYALHVNYFSSFWTAWLFYKEQNKKFFLLTYINTEMLTVDQSAFVHFRTRVSADTAVLLSCPPLILLTNNQCAY